MLYFSYCYLADDLHRNPGNHRIWLDVEAHPVRSLVSAVTALYFVVSHVCLDVEADPVLPLRGLV